MDIKIIFKSLFVLASVSILASCANDDVYNPDNARNTGDLKVPANFDWTTSRTVTTSITSPSDTQISIYSDKDCKDSQLLAEVFVSKAKATEVSLDLPNSSEGYYIKYPTKNGFKVMPVKTTATRVADKTIALPEDTGESGYDDYIDYHYLPAKDTYGMIMFEDLFPAKGDYDFNDLVAGYNVCVNTTRGSGNKFNDGVTIKLQIRAIGGSKPYRLGVEFTPLQTKYVRDNYTITPQTEGINMELISKNDDDPAVFVITGTNKFKEGSFYNTEKLSDTKMPEIICKIERNNFKQFEPASQFIALSNPYNINFFLQNTQSNEEIHLKGYSVTKLASNTDDKFHTTDNFVWGMKLPKVIPHATERTDFTEAYPKFAAWVTSGGTQNHDWYNTHVDGKVINPDK